MVMACGIAWFSAASLLLPLAASGPVAAAGLTIPAVLAARCMVVRAGRANSDSAAGGRSLKALAQW